MTAPAPAPTDVHYRYAFSDLRTGARIGDLPLIDVDWSVALGGAAGKLTASINVADPDVRALDPWAVAVPRRTALYVHRTEIYPGRPPRPHVPWGGIVWDIDPDPAAGRLKLSCATFESYFARRYIDEDRFYSATEQTAIHAGLLSHFQTYRPGASIRVQATPIPTGRVRDRDWLADDDKRLDEALAELAAVEDGFDWYIRPYLNETTNRYEQAVAYGYPRLGRTVDQSGLRLRYLRDGRGTVVDTPQVKRQGSVVANEVRCAGGDVDDVQIREVVTAADLGRDEIGRGYPLLQDLYSDTEVKVRSTLVDHGAAALRQGWASEVLLTGVTIRSDQRPTLADIDLGDDVLLETDDVTWPRPVTLLGRVWGMKTRARQGATSECTQLVLAGEGLSI